MSIVNSEEILSPLWLSAFWLEIEFPIVSKSNHRQHTKNTKAVKWKEIYAFEQNLATLISIAKPESWALPAEKTKIASRPKVVSTIAAKTLLDVSNLSKSVNDACEKLIVVNDAEILSTTSHGIRGKKDQTAVLGWAQLPANSTMLEQWEANKILGDIVVKEFLKKYS